MPDYLSELATIILTYSVVVERIITAIRTIPRLSSWLDGPHSNPSLEKSRQLLLQLLAFAVGTGCAYIVNEGWLIDVENGPVVSVFIVGILASGGSTFWHRFLGLTETLRDAKKDFAPLEKELRRQIASLGLPSSLAGDHPEEAVYDALASVPSSRLKLNA